MAFTRDRIQSDCTFSNTDAALKFIANAMDNVSGESKRRIGFGPGLEALAPANLKEGNVTELKAFALNEIPVWMKQGWPFRLIL